jgi:hypothetical protein
LGWSTKRGLKVIGKGQAIYGSTKSQVPAFAEAASRRQAKFQINPNHPNSKQSLFGHLKLEFGAYLGFGICDLGFQILWSMYFVLH